MTPRTPQCEVFWALLLNFKHLGVRRTPNPHFFQVLGFTPTLGQSRVATLPKTNYELLCDVEMFLGITSVMPLSKVV